MHNWLKRWKLPMSIIIAAAALLLYIIPSLALNIYIEDQRKNVYDQHYESLAMDAVSRTVSQLNYRINLYEVQLTGVAFNEELYNQLLQEYTDPIAQWETVRNMEFAYQYVHGLLPGMTQFRIYHNNPTLLENGGVLWKPGDRLLDGEIERDWYARKLNVNKAEWRVHIQPYNGESYAVLTNNIPRGTAGSIGMLYLKISNMPAFGSVMKSSSDSGTIHAMADDQGVIFLSTDGNMVGMTLENTAFSDLEAIRIASYGKNTVLLRTEDGYHIFNHLSNGWRLYSFIPMSGIIRDMEHLSVLYGIGLVIVLILGVAAVLTIVQYYRMRLKRLNRRLQSDVPDISQPAALQSGIPDHVAQVEAYYGSIVKQMKGLKLREMEEAMRAMESYVNPHFLYNTLGLIRWRALDDGDEDLCSLVDDMTTYYRLSLSGGKSVVTVSDEIAHLQAYIDIQQRRWGDMVQIEYDIDNAALEAYTPKNILQTIVENCYVHGMIPGRNDLRIDISVKKEMGGICFVVADNGMGIEPDKLEYLNRKDDTEISGIGIRSVRQRLHLYFGRNMTMQITSAMGKGTRVMIRIPYCKQEPTIIGGE